MTVKDIMNIVPTMEASALAMDTYKTSKKKSLKIDDMLHSATKVLVGTSLIKSQSGLISSL